MVQILLTGTGSPSRCKALFAACVGHIKSRLERNWGLFLLFKFYNSLLQTSSQSFISC
jgi:hypothetical protein